MRENLPYTIYPRRLKSGETIFYYQYRDEYNRRSTAKSTGCKTLAQAKKYCQKLFDSNQLRISPSIKFGVYAEHFFDNNSDYCRWRKLNQRELKPETLRRYRVSLNYQILPYFNDIPINKITTSTVKDWILWCSDKWKSKTINNAQGTLNIILESAVEKNLIQRNPLYKVGYRKTQKVQKDLLSKEEIKMIYSDNWKNQNARTMFLLTVITGMRIGEVVALQKEDIFENYLDVKHSYSDRYGIGKTKTDLCRYVPIPSDFPFPESQGFIFSENGIAPIKAHCVYNTFIRKCEKLGIDTKERHLTIHSLRNFFISYLQEKNISEPKIRAVVGHAEETMTDLYTFWKPDMFPEVYKAQKELYDFIRSEK